MPSFEQARESAAVHRQRMEKIISVKEGHIVIDQFELFGSGGEYNIPLEQCSTPTEILGWVKHLSEKTWVTNDVMRRFVSIACEELGIDLS